MKRKESDTADVDSAAGRVDGCLFFEQQGNDGTSCYCQRKTVTEHIHGDQYGPDRMGDWGFRRKAPLRLVRRHSDSFTQRGRPHT